MPLSQNLHILEKLSWLQWFLRTWLTELLFVSLVPGSTFSYSRIMLFFPLFSRILISEFPSWSWQDTHTEALLVTFLRVVESSRVESSCRFLVEVFLPGNPCLWSRLEASKGMSCTRQKNLDVRSLWLTSYESYILWSLATHDIWRGISALWGEQNHIDFNLFKLVSGDSLSSDIFGWKQAAGEFIVILWRPRQ